MIYFKISSEVHFYIMKNKSLFSCQPKNPNQKIWRVCPDPKSEFIVLEIREKQEHKNSSQLLILDNIKKEGFRLTEMKATQTLVAFFDKTILVSEIDVQSEMPIAKGLKALNMDFETIWQLEEVTYYGIIEESQTNNECDAKAVFSFQSTYYSVPLNLLEENYDLEANEENYDTLKDRIKQYFYSTDEYFTENENYKYIWDFIFEKTKQKAQHSIFYTESDDYLLCSYLIQNEELQNENHILCTDKKGNLELDFYIGTLEEEENKKPQELLLVQNKIMWIKNQYEEFRMLSV